VRAIDRKLPFEAEVPFDARVRIGGNYRDKESAIVNLLADLPVPGFATTQLALVEPDFDACCA